MHSDREKLVERLRERAEYHSRKGADYGSTRPLSDNELKTAEVLREAIAALSEPVADDAVAKAWDMLVNGGWTPPSTPSDALSRILSTLTRPAGERPAVAVEALREARAYVADALDAHEHSDGRELLGRIDAIPTAEPQAVPEGMVLVPREPTEDMLYEADRTVALSEKYIRGVWRAMLAASPAVQGGDHGE